MLTPKTVYAKAESVLAPAQWAVSLLLIGIIAVCVWALLSKSATIRTAVTVWLLSP